MAMTAVLVIASLSDLFIGFARLRPWQPSSDMNGLGSMEV
jgi:hypothetical protein